MVYFSVWSGVSVDGCMCAMCSVGVFSVWCGVRVCCVHSLVWGCSVCGVRVCCVHSLV